MLVDPLRARCNLLFALFSFLQLALGGCQGRPQPHLAGLFDVHPCKDLTPIVGHTQAHGVDRKALYLCDSKRITWFNVEVAFQDPPFGSATIWNETTTKSMYPPLADLTV